jgi:hypothetical protein
MQKWGGVPIGPIQCVCFEAGLYLPAPLLTKEGNRVHSFTTFTYTLIAPFSCVSRRIMSR